jgi:hypothetical protein
MGEGANDARDQRLTGKPQPHNTTADSIIVIDGTADMLFRFEKSVMHNPKQSQPVTIQRIDIGIS